jgi:FAD:protein FMN transferase
MKRAAIAAAALAVAAVVVQRGARPAGPAVLAGRAMGCEWKLLAGEPIDPAALRSRIATVLEEWEQVLSTWRPDSDLSRHNRGEPASPALARVLALAGQFHHATGGAFDHRLLAQLGEAGFGPGGSGIDLSSIGKGFAVDRVVESLDAAGLRRFAFSLAGEVRTRGTWPVTLENPETGGAGPVVELAGQALATSGNRHLWQAAPDGRRRAHILDPASGRPVERPPCSVTVIAPDAATASAWATALFVLGPAGNPLAHARGLEVVWQGRVHDKDAPRGNPAL